jgi:hypothetical protein
MAYVRPNFKSKKKLKEAIKANEPVFIFQPNADVTGFDLQEGPREESVEGPHYPEPHRWYARVKYDEDFKVTKVIS